MDAALATFAEKGFEGATLDEVAERAEFGKGTLYNYFPEGKESILFALLEQVYDELVSLTDEYFSDQSANSDVRESFRGFIAIIIGHFIDKLPMFMFLVKEAHRMAFDDEEKNATYLLSQRERVAAAIAFPIQKAMDSRLLKDFDAHTVAHLILGNVHGYMMYTCSPAICVEAAQPDAEKGAEFITTILFDGLLAN